LIFCGYFRSLQLSLLQWLCQENPDGPLTLLTNRIKHLAGSQANGGAARKCVATSHLPAARELLPYFQPLAGSVKQLHTCEAATHYLSGGWARFNLKIACELKL
jgi:hypothetical protein